MVNQSRRWAGVALRTSEAVGLAANRLLGGVFERHDFATLYIGFSELGHADRAACVALLEASEPFFLRTGFCSSLPVGLASLAEGGARRKGLGE